MIPTSAREVVADLHEAYARVRLDQTAYGCFMMGPSATGDIEATMVHGAQRARSLNVFFLASNMQANNLPAWPLLQV